MTDFRLIAATRTPVRQAVTDGALREDLYLRLNASSIALTIAAAVGSTPASPTPFAPSGLNGVGDSTWIKCGQGTTSNVGSR